MNTRLAFAILLGAIAVQAQDSKLVQTVHAFYAERAAREGAIGAKTRAVTVLQRTSSDLRLNPHLHAVFLDGAWHEPGGELTWQGLRHLKPPEAAEASWVIAHALTNDYALERRSLRSLRIMALPDAFQRFKSFLCKDLSRQRTCSALRSSYQCCHGALALRCR